MAEPTDNPYDLMFGDVCDTATASLDASWSRNELSVLEVSIFNWDNWFVIQLFIYTCNYTQWMQMKTFKTTLWTAILYN